MEGVEADVAYDRRKEYAELERRGAKAVIPPRRDAKIHRHGNKAGPRLARDENLRHIRRIGRAACKVESGYRRRSLGETMMFRIKTIFAGGAASRRPEQQSMTHQKMPVSERVEA